MLFINIYPLYTSCYDRVSKVFKYVNLCATDGKMVGKIDNMSYSVSDKFTAKDAYNSGSGFGFSGRSQNFVVRKTKMRSFLIWVRKETGKDVKPKYHKS